MNRATSAYLDFMRISSAFLVFAYHARAERFNGEWLTAIGSFGHDAVIVFFVLSGFVIAYTTSKQPADISHFVKSRLARLYSVALPALLFTVAADSLGQYLKPDIYIAPYYQDSFAVSRFIHNLFFLNELWFESWRAFSNGPFWSLSYEFFYYLLYAVAFYLRGMQRLLFVIITATIAGPKILLLLPVWILGALLYHFTRYLSFSKSVGVLLIFGSITLYAAYRSSPLPEYLYELTKQTLGASFVRQQLEFSRWFLNDYIVAILVSIHISGVISISDQVKLNKNIQRYLSTLAGTTFTLYLFHYPLLQLYGSVFNHNLIIVMFTLASVALIAPVTEGQKSFWRKLFDQIHCQLTMQFNKR